MNKNFELTRNKFQLEDNKHFEGSFAQGNGYIFLRGSLEEGLLNQNQGEIYTREFKSVTTEEQKNPISKWGTYIPLIMGNHPLLNEVIINLPYFMDFRISVDGEPLYMNESHISEFQMKLNMKNGHLIRSFIWETKSGKKIKCNYERFASRKNKHLFVQNIQYQAIDGNVDIVINSGIDTNVTTNGYNHFIKTYKSADNDSIQVLCKTDMKQTVFMKTLLDCDEKPMEPKNNEFQSIYHLIASEKINFIKKTFVSTSLDLDINKTAQDQSKNFETLAKESDEICNLMWENSDVKIEGNIKDQLAVRYSIYHLLRCKEESEYRTSICAKGFAGEAYYGRYFWDSEIFMLPFYIYTNPQIAKNLLMYRYHTLDGARENANRYNCRGARYPWQSGTTGTEQCSLWEYADNEIHITADIVYGIWHYFKGTDDFEFLKNYGSEIIIETARFWVDRVDIDENGQYNLLNVMGPDEYTAFNKNNSFTNHLVKFNLEKAVETIELLENQETELYDKLRNKIKLEGNEKNQFKEIADKIKIIVDEKSEYIQQSENFNSYAKTDINQIWQDKTKPFGHYMTQEKLYRSKVLKQADSISLAMLFKSDFSMKQIENTYNYFEPITTHDSSLSPINHAIVAGWIGNKQHLQKFLDYSLELDYNYEKRGAEEGIHIANCGCIHQFIMQTIAGIDTAIVSDTPSPKLGKFNLPESWKTVEFKIIWKSKKYKIIVNNMGTTIQELK